MPVALQRLWVVDCGLWTCRRGRRKVQQQQQHCQVPVWRRERGRVGVTTTIIGGPEGRPGQGKWTERLNKHNSHTSSSSTAAGQGNTSRATPGRLCRALGELPTSVVIVHPPLGRVQTQLRQPMPRPRRRPRPYCCTQCRYTAAASNHNHRMHCGSGNTAF